MGPTRSNSSSFQHIKNNKNALFFYLSLFSLSLSYCKYINFSLIKIILQKKQHNRYDDMIWIIYYTYTNIYIYIYIYIYICTVKAKCEYDLNFSTWKRSFFGFQNYGPNFERIEFLCGCPPTQPLPIPTKPFLHHPFIINSV